MYHKMADDASMYFSFLLYSQPLICFFFLFVYLLFPLFQYHYHLPAITKTFLSKQMTILGKLHYPFHSTILVYWHVQSIKNDIWKPIKKSITIDLYQCYRSIDRNKYSHTKLSLSIFLDLPIVIESIEIKYCCVYNAILQGLIVPK